MLLIFGIVLGGSTREDIMAHWSERRCDLDVMLMAFIYISKANSNDLNFQNLKINLVIYKKLPILIYN